MSGDRGAEQVKGPVRGKITHTRDSKRASRQGYTKDWRVTNTELCLFLLTAHLHGQEIPGLFQHIINSLSTLSGSLSRQRAAPPDSLPHTVCQRRECAQAGQGRAGQEAIASTKQAGQATLCYS